MKSDTILMANSSLTVEEFEDEIVLLDVVRGLYFSLSGAATELWRAFAEHRNVAEVIDTLHTQLKGADRAQLQSSIQRMCDNQLLLPGISLSEGSHKSFATTTTVFTLPKVEVFDDLADLISIDPVHEVGAAGWPVKPNSFPNVF